MAAIGDLIMRVIADLKGFTTSVEKEAGKAGEKGGKALTKGMARHTSSLKKGVLQGLGLGAGLGVIGLAAGAIGGIADAIGNMTKAAIVDAESQQKLQTTLKANIPAWNGNTDAIEKTIKARMALGFSDDEQRDSLALAIVATKDETKALDLQRAAMDLARLKKISLAEATTALIKVEGGQFKLLKGMGIEVRKGAKAEEALAAVRAAAAGQAEDYADTVGGKVLANQIAFDERMENFGANTLPLVIGALDTLNGMLDGVSGATRDGIQGLEAETAALIEQHGSLEQQQAILEQVLQARKDLLSNPFATQSEQDSINRSVEALQRYGGSLTTTVGGFQKLPPAASAAADGVSDATGDIGDDFDTMSDAAKEAAANVGTAYHDMVKDMISDGQALLNGFFDPIEIREGIRQDRLDLHAAQEAARNAKTKGAYKDAAAAVIESLDSQGGALFELGEQGKLTTKDVDKFKADTIKSYAALGRKVPAALQLILDKLYEVAAVDGITIGVTIKEKGRGKVQIRAAGGPVQRGVPYVVGERRPELFVPSVSGRVIPNLNSPAAQNASGYTDNSTVNLTALPVKADLMTAVHELQRISDGKRLRRWG